MNNEEKYEEVRALCPHYSDGKCYYETNEVSKCDCECEFCWCFDIMIANGYKKLTKEKGNA